MSPRVSTLSILGGMCLRGEDRASEGQESSINLVAASRGLDVLAERSKRDLSTDDAVVAEGR